MPAEGVHLTSLREAAASPRLPGAARKLTVRYEDAARLGAVLPDLPYFDGYAGEVIRYALHIRPRPSPWGNVVHERAAVSIVGHLLAAARRARSDVLAALALGATSHAAIDRVLHPLVNALARRHRERGTHDEAHREVEKFQSICFHEAYFGADRMGAPGIVRLVAVPASEVLAAGPVSRAVAAAFAASMPGAPTEKVLRRMARGYEQHARLLGTPLGAIIASERDKERARPKYLHAAWGTFEDVLARAIDASIPVVEATWNVYTATDLDADAARLELDRLLPAGSIDDPGHSVDLDAPFSQI